MWLTAARILTGDPAQPLAHHVGWSRGRIRYVGMGPPPVSPAAVRYRYPEHTVLPGLIDSHVHLGFTAFSQAVPCATGVRVREELRAHLRAWGAAARAEGQDLLWITGYDGEHWGREGEGLSPEEMDAAAGLPVYMVHRTGHAAYLSRQALERLPVPFDREGVVRSGGEPTGEVVGPAHMELAARMERSEAYLRRVRANLDATALGLRRAGLTTICALEEEPIVAHLLRQEPRLPLRLQVFWQTRDPGKPAAAGLGRVGGCQTVAVDGEPIAHTMALTAPYADDPGNLGSLYWSEEELAAFCREAARRNLQVALHAIGDRAIDRVLDAYEAAGQGQNPGAGRRPPWRIEHAELPRPGQVVRARRLGVALAIQPSFNWVWPQAVSIPSLGVYRSLCLDPVASLMAMGALLGGGSDSPVTPAQPLLGMAAAMDHSNPDERLDWPSALALFTRENARIMGEEGRLGRIAPGWFADFAVLRGDLSAPTAPDLRAAQVEATFVDGEPEGNSLPWRHLERRGSHPRAGSAPADEGPHGDRPRP